MKFLKSTSNIILISVIFILLIALIISLDKVYTKNKYISTVNKQIVKNEEIINKTDSKIEDYEKTIEENKKVIEDKDKSDSELKQELEKIKQEKENLQKENESLKKQIAELKAKKTDEKSVKPAVQSPQPNGSKVCYLTFDDGPSPNTLQILDILKRYNVKATFFVINSKYNSYIKMIYDEGHTIGLHTFTHDYKTIYSSVNNYFNDLQNISDLVESITGQKTTVMRFPGGSSNKVSAKYCKGLMTQLVKLVSDRGFSYFDWNVSSGDAESITPSYTYIRNNVINSCKTKNSACVLMHDAGAKTTTVQALPEIIEALTKMGYSFESIKPETYGYHHQTLNN